jgi:hypothetical protein
MGLQKVAWKSTFGRASDGLPAILNGETPVSTDMKTVIKVLTDRLVANGYRKSKLGIFVKPGGVGLLMWLGLNRAKRSGLVDINPVVGIRHQGVEDLVAELSGRKADQVIPPTAAMNVGYLSQANRYQAFVFGEGRPDDEVASELTNAVLSAGSRLLHENEDMAGLISTLSTSKNLIPDQTAYRLPVALFIAGRGGEATRALDVNLGEIAGRTDPSASRYVVFAERLKARMVSDIQTVNSREGG